MSGAFPVRIKLEMSHIFSLLRAFLISLVVLFKWENDIFNEFQLGLEVA